MHKARHDPQTFPVPGYGAGRADPCPTSPGGAKPAAPTLAQWAKGQGYVAIPLRRVASNHQVVEVTINGKPALFLLDSGAAGTVIDRAQLGAFQIGPALRSGDGVGAGGSIKDRCTRCAASGSAAIPPR